MGAVSLRLILRTHYLNPQSVIVEVSEAVSLALENFHFGVESFGDSVVSGEAPHAGDFVAPGKECLSQGDEWGETATTERSHIGEEPLSQLLTAFVVPAFFQEQILSLIHI